MAYYVKKRRRRSGDAIIDLIQAIGYILVVFLLIGMIGSMFKRAPANAALAVDLQIADFENGIVAPNKESYRVGDVVTLTIAPTECYSQKLCIDGEPLILDWKTNTYSFVAEKPSYEISGSFEKSLDMTYDADRWSTINQAHGILNTYYITEDSSWLAVNGDYHTASVMVKNYLAGEDGSGGEGFAVSLGLSFSNGKTYTYRVIKEGGSYYCQRFNMGGSWQKFALTDDIVAAICGDGAKFTVERVGPNQIAVFVNEVNFDTYTMGDVGEGNAVTKVNIGHYGNKNTHIGLPFEVLTGE